MGSLMINSLHNHCWVRRWIFFEKSVNVCRSHGQLSRGSFLWNTVYIVYFWRRAGLSASAELLVILVVNCSASCVRTLLVKLRNYRTALRRAHTSAKVTVPAKLLLLNKRSVKHTQYAGYDSAHTYKPSIAESFILRPTPNHNRNRKSTLQLLGSVRQVLYNWKFGYDRACTCTREVDRILLCSQDSS